MPSPGASATQDTPLAPSVEKAYYRKCIELKRRLNEVEEANDSARLRKLRLNRAIMKMRLERAFLLDQLAKRMELDDDEESKQAIGNSNSSNYNNSHHDNEDEDEEIEDKQRQQQQLEQQNGSPSQPTFGDYSMTQFYHDASRSSQPAASPQATIPARSSGVTNQSLSTDAGQAYVATTSERPRCSGYPTLYRPPSQLTEMTAGVYYDIQVRPFHHAPPQLSTTAPVGYFGNGSACPPPRPPPPPPPSRT